MDSINTTSNTEKSLINTSEIKIAQGFDPGLFSMKKLVKRYTTFMETKSLKAIKIDSNNILVDGYISYIIAICKGIDKLEYKQCASKFDNSQVLNGTGFSIIEMQRILTEIENFANSNTAEKAREIYAKQNERCYICDSLLTLNKAKADFYERAMFATKKQLVFGGSLSGDNLILCCKKCFKMKGKLVLSPELIKVIRSQRKIDSGCMRIHSNHKEEKI